jgi:hypothetical protein
MSALTLKFSCLKIQEWTSYLHWAIVVKILLQTSRLMRTLGWHFQVNWSRPSQVIDVRVKTRNNRLANICNTNIIFPLIQSVFFSTKLLSQIAFMVSFRMIFIIQFIKLTKWKKNHNYTNVYLNHEKKRSFFYRANGNSLSRRWFSIQDLIHS